MASQIRTEEKSVPFFILPFSAECATSLEVLRRNHIDALELIKGEDELASYCYTASTSWPHFSQFRSVVTGANLTELLDALRSEPLCSSKMHDVMKENSEAESNGPTPLSFLFSGAGAEFFQMGLELYQTCPSYRSHFDDINSHLMDLDGIDLLRWFRDGEEIPLYRLLSTFALEYSLLKMWEDWGVRPTLCVVGHSFGELAAAVATGVLSLPTAARLIVYIRQTILEKVIPGSMLLLLTDETTTISLINQYTKRKVMGNETGDEWIDVSIINTPKQTVVSGPTHVITNFATFVPPHYIRKAKPIDGIVHPFHSRSMEQGSTEFKKYIEKLEFSSLNDELKYISSMYGKQMEVSQNLDVSYWVQWYYKPAQFIDSATSAVALGAQLFLELSSQPILSKLMKINCPEANLFCIPSLKKNISNWQTLMEAVASLYLHRIEVDWTKIWNSLNDDCRCIKPVPHLMPAYSLQGEPALG